MIQHHNDPNTLILIKFQELHMRELNSNFKEV